LLWIPIHSTINFFGGGWRILCFLCARCTSESKRWLQKLSLDYAAMHICTKRCLQKICLWNMQHNLHLSVRDDWLQTFVFGLCNMHAPASSQHRREVAECDYTLHIALKVSPLKPNHPSSSSRIPAHRYSNQQSYHLHGKSGTVTIICCKNLKDYAQQPDSKPVGGYPVICIGSQLTNSWVILDHYEQN
jgi:hypothetical protein